MNLEAHMSNKTGLAQSQIKYVSAFELPLSYCHNSTNFLNRYSNLISPYSCLRAAYTILMNWLTERPIFQPSNRATHCIMILKNCLTDQLSNKPTWVTNWEMKGKCELPNDNLRSLQNDSNFHPCWKSRLTKGFKLKYLLTLFKHQFLSFFQSKTLSLDCRVQAVA